MTEPNPAAELQAERLARLRQRSSSTAGDASRSRRRQKAGRSSKIVIAGASTTAMLGLVATYGYVNLPANTDNVQTTSDGPSTSTVQPVAVPTAVVETTSAPHFAESIVVINSDGMLLSAPADLDPAIVQLALEEYRAAHPIESVAATTPPTAPTTASAPAAAPAPKSIDLAVPAPPPVPKRQAASSSRRNNGGGGGGSSSDGGSARAPTPAPRPSQSKSKGS